MKKLKISYKKIDEINTYPNNAKKHTSEQIEQIKKSIQEFGFNDPIAIYENGEIAEGHGRYLSAVELGIKEIPVIVLEGLTEDEKKAYRIIHNQLTLNGGFDIDLLNMELEKIADLDMEQFGFEILEIDENDYSNYFEDAEEKTKEPKQMQCPYCGEWFDL